ncbi:unnamed protein product, partial [Ranitomeya imitator]
MERSLLLTDQTLNGIDEAGDGRMELQDDEVASWVTVKRPSRGKSAREASPDLTHPNKFAKLADEGGASTGVALLQPGMSSESRRSDCSSKEGNRRAGQARQVLVVGDSIIRGTEGKSVTKTGIVERCAAYLALESDTSLIGWTDYWEGLIGIPEAAVKRCARQISSALDFMHSRGLVPRDLKPDNTNQIKLSDFGLTQPAGYYVSSMSHIVPYMSPELYDLKDGEYLLLSPTIDTWAFGILLFVALTGYFPWLEATVYDSMYQVYINWRQCADCTPPPACWKMLSREAICMFNNLLSQCPSSRQSVLSIFNNLNFPWK